MRKFLAGALLVLLTACGTLRPTAVPERPERGAIAAFSIEGRLSLRQGERPYAAHIAWRHDPASDEIFITGPLGQGIAELSRNAGGAKLVTADRKTTTAADWTALAEELLGVPLPLSGMAHWIAGEASASAWDDLGRPLKAQEAGWNIDYLDYEVARPDALPVLVELRRDDIEVRIRIDEWLLNPD
ncbi:MAG: lipoprotein insertase outer membrane protein LolB [Rhodocyclaceae bacterium]|jgi:outer membrane lipoprotein LolB|nr:lipoprotein insertase outer membrane protein LolB [Rhodocyclaceae bacterium]